MFTAGACFGISKFSARHCVESSRLGAPTIGTVGGIPSRLALFRPREGDQHPSLFIDALYVCRADRSQGVGSALLGAALNAAGAHENRLFVYTAIAPWYQRRGWTVVQREADGAHFVLETRLR